MLHTIELLVGITPMTQFDAFATPMYRSFTDKPNTAPYTAITPTTPLNERNTAASPMAAQASTQDFSREDLVDPATLNTEIWQSVRGTGSPMPAPQHNLQQIAAKPAAAQPVGTPADPDGDGH